METLNLSASSGMGDIDDLIEGDKIDILNIQNVILQNERLQEINSQLSASLESVKAQLKQALEASATVNSMSEQVKSLKCQLLQEKKKREKLEKEVQVWRQKCTGNLPADALVPGQETAELIRKLSKSKKEIQKLRFENEELSSLLEQTRNSEAKLKKSKAKLRKRIQACLDRLKKSEEDLANALAKNGPLETSNEAMKCEIEELKLELSSAQSLNHEAETAWNGLRDELEKSNIGFDQLSKQITSQAEEIAGLTEEKGKMSALIQKLHSALCISEANLEETKKANAMLESRVKSQKLQVHDDTFLFRDLEFPFDGPLKEKCVKIAGLDHYQPVQRVQLMLNELGHVISTQKSDIDAKTAALDDLKSKLETEQSTASVVRQAMSALQREIRNIAVEDEKMGKYAIYDSDDGLASFIAHQTVAMEKCVVDEEKGIPSDFFSLDVDHKRRLVMQNLQANESAMALFSAQFHINLLLKKGLKKAIAASVRNEDLEELLQILKCGNTNDLAHNLQILKEQLMKVMANFERAKKYIKKLQQSLMAKNRAESEQKLKVEQLQLKNETLANECELLTVKCQVAENQVAVLKSECSSLSECVEKGPAASGEVVDVREKEEEISRLSSELKEIKAAHEIQLARQKRHAKRGNEELQARVEKLQGALTEAENRNAELQKKAKKIKKLFAAKFEESNREYEKQILTVKASYEEATQTMKQKSEKSREMSQKLLQSLSESEQYNQQMQSENAQLHIQNKSLEVKLTTLQEQMKKERQNIENRIAVQRVACDSKVQEVTRHMKQAIEEEKTRLFSLIVHMFASLYSIDASDFDEHALLSLCDRIKRDIEKLRAFQSSVQF